jgi:CHAT domain-containing protein
VFFGKRAVELLQSVRGDLTGIEKQLQASFLLSREETYRSLIDNLISLDRLAEAQEIAKLLKEQEFASIAGTRGPTGPDVVPYSEAEESVLNALERLARLRKDRAALQAEKEAAGAAFAKQAELKAIDDKLVLISAAFQTTLKNLADAEPTVSERVKKIFEERNLQTVLSTLKKSHNTEAVAIYVVIGTEPETDAAGNEIKEKVRTKFGWTVLVTATDRKAYPIDVGGLDESVRRFRQAVEGDKYDPRPDAKKIYDAVFKQASAKLRTTLQSDLDAALASSENKTVMWSLDGMLRYVPIAALHDGERYLVEKYRNVIFTRQSLAQLAVPNVAQWKVLGMGMSDARPGFPALHGAAEELQYIVRPEMYAGKVLLNNEFKKDDALSAWRDKQYPVIHIASHFKFHPTKPDQSYLLLGDGELKIADIQYDDNLFDGVDLLALSACDTAMVSNGKESESFAYVAQDLGAKTVLASLWPVSDAGTPELMTRFYSLRLANMSMSKGEAFHRAQLSLVRGDEIAALKPFQKKESPDPRPERSEPFGSGPKNLPLFTKDKLRPFAHPFYWAPFILIGNWR